MKFFSAKTTSVALWASVSMAMPISSFASKASSSSSSWLNRQINKHPDIFSANESVKAVFSKAKGSANNFSFSINQTVNSSDKQKSSEVQ